MRSQGVVAVNDALATSPETLRIRRGPHEVACSIWAQPGIVPEGGVVLIHGNAANRHWWDAVAPSLCGEERLVAAVDLTGHGDSSRSEEYTLESWAEQVLEVAEALCPGKRLGLVGHSMGGLIALKAAWHCPSAVDRLVLLDTPLRRHLPGAVAKRERLARRPLTLHATKAEAIARFKTVPPSNGPHELMRHVAGKSVVEVDGGWQSKVDPQIYLRCTDPDEFLRPWPGATTVVRGEVGMISEEMAHSIRMQLGSRGSMIDMPGVGHNMLLEDPLGTARIIATGLG